MTIQKMRKILLAISAFIATGFANIQAQQIEVSLWFKTGRIQTEELTMDALDLNDPKLQSERFQGKLYGIAIFDHIPSFAANTDGFKGIHLLEYLPDDAYFASLDLPVIKKNWTESGLRSFIPVKAAWKLDPNLIFENNTIKQAVWVHYADEKERFAYRKNLVELGFEVREDHYLSKAFELVIAKDEVVTLQKIPYLFWITSAPSAPEINNWDERTNHRVPAVEPGSGTYALTGKNVVVGEWDGTGVGTHIDYDFRHVRMEPHANNSNGAHATHVAGTVLGAGILNPIAKGMAPEALLYSWDFGGNIPVEMDSGALKQKIEITQNSYSYGSDPCSVRGTYDGTSQALDRLVVKYPHLLHVYAAGNSRGSNCMTGGYRTVHSGFQASKNALVVAAVTHLDANSSFHSYGPTMDGRLKPDLSAVGVNVYSTAHNHTYLGGYSGTSMACPGTSGTSALIYELYENKYRNQPSAHIIKGIMCNASDDIGRPGPDFMYGYGRINARVAADMINANRFVTRSLVHSSQFSDTIFVPQNSHELKVLLCWDDVPASSSVGKSLVNDLDLILYDSAGNQFLPWILNPTNPTANAVRGVDTLNNSEQVTISKPGSPYYIYRVTGSKIPVGAQEFSLSWNIQDTGITVTYPNGDERWVPPSSSTNAQIIRWDNRGISGNVKIEYSTNAGSTWNNVVTSTPSANLYYVWQTCPDTVVTSKALIRISAPGVSDVSDSVFHIMKIPTSPTGIICDSQVHLSWPVLSGAIGYEVFMHDSGIMKSMGTTNIPEFTVRKLNNNVAYWFAISALGNNGAQSERCQARMFTPISTTTAPKFTVQPADMRVCIGKDTAVQVALSGSPTISSYWQYSDNKGVTWIKTGADNQLKLNIINPTIGLNNRWFRHYAVNACQSKEYTRVAVLNVDSSFSFKYHAAEVKACIGQDTAILLQYKSSNPPAFQWYYQKTLADAAIPLTGNSDRLHLPNNQKSNQGYYKVSLANACGTFQNSAPTYLRVRDALNLQVPADDTICQGNAFLLQVGATGGDTINYRFQWTSDDGIYTGSKVSVQPIKTTRWEVGVFDKCSQDTVEAFYTLYVRDSIKLNLSNDTIVCKGTTVNLTARVSGGLFKGYSFNWSGGLTDQANHQFKPTQTQTYYLTFTDNCTQYVLSDSVKVVVLDALKVSIETPLDTICVGQFADLKAKATGGKSTDYRYKWSDGSTGSVLRVQPGTTQTYSVKLEDLCTVNPDSNSFTLRVRMPITAEISGKDTTCFNVLTPYQAIVNGGKVNGYQYFWQGKSDLASVDFSPKKSFKLYLRIADGCTVKDAYDTLDVFVYDSLSANATFTDSLVCYGQSVFLPVFPKGGRPNQYKASWSNGANTITGLQTVNTIDQTYQITITDGCSHPAIHDFNIKTRPPLQISAGPDIRICNGETARTPLLISGGLASAYQIQINGAVVNANHEIVFKGNSGDSMRYSFLLKDGCTVPDAYDSLLISVDDVNPYFKVGRRYDKELLLISPYTPHDAAYRFGDGFSHQGNDQNVTHNYLDYNLYSVCRFTSSDIGCRDTMCQDIHIYDVFETSGFNISLSPNPTDGKIYATFDKIAGNLRFEVWSADGKLVYSKSVENYLEDRVEVDLSPYAPAMYWLKFITNEEVNVFKVIKQ